MSVEVEAPWLGVKLLVYWGQVFGWEERSDEYTMKKMELYYIKI